KSPAPVPSANPTDSLNAPLPAPTTSDTVFEKRNFGSVKQAPGPKSKLAPSKASTPAPSSFSPPDSSNTKGEEGSLGNLGIKKKSSVTLNEKPEPVEHQAVHAQPDLNRGKPTGSYLTLPFPQPEPNYTPKLATPSQQAASPQKQQAPARAQ